MRSHHPVREATRNERRALGSLPARHGAERRNSRPSSMFATLNPPQHLPSRTPARSTASTSASGMRRGAADVPIGTKVKSTTWSTCTGSTDRWSRNLDGRGSPAGRQPEFGRGTEHPAGAATQGAGGDGSRGQRPSSRDKRRAMVAHGHPASGLLPIGLFSEAEISENKC